jgi:hypothetical protein
MSSNPNCLADRRLKQRCLDGEQAAWLLLYTDNYPGLVCYVQTRLAARPIPWLAADDVASNVFASLWEDKCRLVHYYDPERGTWQAFLRKLAGQQIGIGWRQEMQRRKHERPWEWEGRDVADLGADQGLVQAELHEFAAALPPVLQAVFAAECLGVPLVSVPAGSPDARRQRRHRLRQEIRNFV